MTFKLNNIAIPVSVKFWASLSPHTAVGLAMDTIL
jgi:hypothetical protein